MAEQDDHDKAITEHAGGQYKITSNRPPPEGPPEGSHSHGAGRIVHSRAGEYGDFHPENVYDEVERSGRDEAKRFMGGSYRSQMREEAYDQGYDPRYDG